MTYWIPSRQRLAPLHLLFWVGLLALAGCAETTPPPIRLGINPWPGYEALFLARDKGFFAATKVPVQLVEYSDLADVRRAFMQGHIDGMTCTLIEVLQACDLSARCPQVVMVTDFSNGADVILAASTIPSMSALRGKRVAVETHSMGMFLLSRALARFGMQLDDVVLVPRNQLHMAQDLQKGHVDAVVSYPPVSLELQRHEGVHSLFSSADILGEIVDVIALDPQVLHQRRKEVAGILRAWDQALEFVAAQPEEAYRLMADRERITVPEFRHIFQSMQLLSSMQQHSLLASHGPVNRTLSLVDRVLRESRQLRGPERTRDRLTPLSGQESL